MGVSLVRFTTTSVRRARSSLLPTRPIGAQRSDHGPRPQAQRAAYIFFPFFPTGRGLYVPSQDEPILVMTVIAFDELLSPGSDAKAQLRIARDSALVRRVDRQKA